MLFVSVNDFTIIGGNGGLIYAGTSGTGTTLLNYFSGTFRNHHPVPKYLLGPENQELYRMSEQDHVKYHQLLDYYLPRRFGRNYYNEILNPQTKQGEFYEWLRGFLTKFLIIPMAHIFMRHWKMYCVLMDGYQNLDK